MAHGYATTNAAAGLDASAFTFTNWTAANKGFLNDAAMDSVCSTGVATGTTRYIAVNLGSAKSLVGVALLNHNLATWSGGTVKVEGASDAAFTTDLATAKDASTITTTAPNDKDAVLQFPALSRQYWRLTFVSSSTEAIRLGELMFLTSITSLSRLKAYGNGESEEYISNTATTRTGNVRSTFLAGPIRSKRMPFVDLQGNSQREELMAMWRTTYGGVVNLLWIETVESVTTAATAEGMACIWGKLQDKLSWRENDYTLFDVDALEIRSVGRDVGR